MHRDIKPQNIILNYSNKQKEEKRLILIDFGFAIKLQNGDTTVLKETVGTPSYMAP